ncbi:hypothetical protein Cus16_0706 [Curtobacterium sp. ER1/6]|nr:hypothetical protein Cus16_0706 [Curtobacterium sp. ER1/6]
MVRGEDHRPLRGDVLTPDDPRPEEGEDERAEQEVLEQPVGHRRLQFGTRVPSG